MLEGCADTWVDPHSIFGREGVHERGLAARMLKRRGLRYQVTTTTMLAIRSRETLVEIDPEFGRWTDCAIYDDALNVALRLVAFERVEDAVMYRLIVQ